jgi:hypothetical protein
VELRELSGVEWSRVQSRLVEFGGLVECSEYSEYSEYSAVSTVSTVSTDRA